MVIWLVKPSAFTMHLIEFNPSYPPNESNDTAVVADPADIPRGHHICFSVTNFESFVQKLKVYIDFAFRLITLLDSVRFNLSSFFNYLNLS